jgi:hypothetical protein
MPPDPERLDRQYAAARAAADRVGAFDLPHYLATGTGGEAWLRGERPGGRVLPIAARVDDPDRDWLQRPLARKGSVTVELTGGLATVVRVEAVTRGVHPRALTLAALGRAAVWEEWGEMKPLHGPGRDERRWVWEGTVDRREATRIRLFALAGRNGMRLLDVRILGLEEP